MRALGLVEPQSSGERFEHLERSAHVASLLQPRVPGCAYACELRDLLAAQPGGSSAASVRQPHVLWLKRAPPGSQEVRKLAATRSRIRGVGFMRLPGARPAAPEAGGSRRGGTG